MSLCNLTWSKNDTGSGESSVLVLALTSFLAESVVHVRSYGLTKENFRAAYVGFQLPF